MQLTLKPSSLFISEREQEVISIVNHVLDLMMDIPKNVPLAKIAAIRVATSGLPVMMSILLVKPVVSIFRRVMK